MTPVDPITPGKPTVGYIRYQGGFKYQLTEDFSYLIPADLWEKIKIKEDINSKFARLDVNGELLLLAGFAWNGVSGPTIDRATNTRGGCIHDGLCRLIRYGDLPLSARDSVDEVLRRVWIEDGMWAWLATSEVKIMRAFCDSYVRPSTEPTVMTAP